MDQTREQLPFDILFVGAGPANLASAIHLMELAREKKMKIEVGMIEKGDTIGSHAISGAILDPIALKELIPNYLERGCPIEQTECRDNLYFLTRKGCFSIPFTPKYLHNEACLVISLSKFTRWLGGLAEEMGVNIFPGFAGTEVLYNADANCVIGVRTGDKGIDKHVKKSPTTNLESI